MTRRAAVLLVVVLAAPVAAQNRYKPGPTADGHPDLTGIWEMRGTANWNLEGHTGLAEEGNPAALTFPRRSAGYPLQGIPDCPNWDIWLLFPRSTSSLPDRQIYPASAVREYGSA